MMPYRCCNSVANLCNTQKKKSGKISVYKTSSEKKKKTHREDDMTEYDREAQKIFDHYFKASYKNKRVWKPYHMDKILEV